MLTLSRKDGERINLYSGERKIVIQVVRREGRKTVIGIEAERSVMVLREEIDTPENRGVLQEAGYAPGFVPPKEASGENTSKA